ncbi:MAG: insulinase family protein [Gemmatimonadetes bacterium]|nr:insulinase family protein [Gemmatimonadota bacterium]
MTDQHVRSDLPGGLVALTERMPGVRSVAIGVWVRTGSAHEPPEEMGVSHLLEHMVFKGTLHRSARDLALALERLGGSLDAYTTREHTGFQARVLDEHAAIAIDVLADLVLSPLLRAEDLDLEREVVLEEISTVEDTPDDLIFDLHATQVWGDHPYGYPVLGTRDSVSGLTPDAVRRAHSRAYRSPNLIVAAAGSVDHDGFIDQIEALFGKAPPGGANGSVPELPAVAPETRWLERDSVQTHIVFGRPTIAHGDPRRYAMILLSNAFGGGMSSRLFQRVREEMGLAYSVFSYQSFYRGAGVAGVYLGTRPEWADRAEAVIHDELRELALHGLTADELADAKGQVKGQLVLSLESTGARLHRLAGTALYDEPFRTVEQVMAEVDAVTPGQVAELAAEFYAPDRQHVLRLGPATGTDHHRMG